MMLRSLVTAALTALALSACGPSPTHRPDNGGVALCDPDRERFLAVIVQDQDGEPVSGAVVTAKNLGTGLTVKGTTNKDGITTSVGSNLGSGSVEVSATLNTRASDVKQAEFVCGECGCDINPESLVLQIVR